MSSFFLFLCYLQLHGCYSFFSAEPLLSKATTRRITDAEAAAKQYRSKAGQFSKVRRPLCHKAGCGTKKHAGFFCKILPRHFWLLQKK